MVAETHVSDDGTASLRHTVDFGDLDVITLLEKQLAEQLAGEQGSLAADTDDHYIFRFHGQSSFAVLS